MKNLDQNINFRLDFTNENFQPLTEFIHSFMIPGFSKSSIPVQIPYINPQFPLETVEFNNFTLTLFVDDEYEILKHIYKNSGLEKINKIENYTVDSFYTNILIQKLNNQGNVAFTITLHDAFITSVDDISVEFTPESTLKLLTLNFNYKFYTFE